MTRCTPQIFEVFFLGTKQTWDSSWQTFVVSVTQTQSRVPISHYQPLSPKYDRSNLVLIWLGWQRGVNNQIVLVGVRRVGRCWRRLPDGVKPQTGTEHELGTPPSVNAPRSQPSTVCHLHCRPSTPQSEQCCGSSLWAQGKIHKCRHNWQELTRD